VTAIHRFVESARAGTLPRVIARVPSGWVVLGDPQILPGYCVLMPDPVVADLHVLSADGRARFLHDMARVGDAVRLATGATRLNYEMLGNVEPALHAHVIPRYDAEPDDRRRQPVWLHDWAAAEPFDADRHASLMRQIAVLLDEE
jgi:diadenosine tetraphosphate (Ap4A) HIT family hydrolase